MLWPVQLGFVIVLLGRGMVAVEIVPLHGADCWDSRRAFITREGGEGLFEKAFEVKNPRCYLLSNLHISNDCSACNL